MSRTILIADDESHIRDTVRAYLQEAGFQVLTAQNGREAVFVTRHEKPDVVILDVMMPELDGWEAARLIRRESDVPIIFLTARVEETDQVTGLELGADEYITKPFSPRVLVARVRAVLRRTHGDLASEPTTWRVGDLELNTETRLVSVGGKRVELTPSEFDLLAALIQRPGESSPAWNCWSGCRARRSPAMNAPLTCTSRICAPRLSLIHVSRAISRRFMVWAIA